MALTRSKKVVQTNWHPDFRNIDALPDIKVVRTDFFVNILTVTIASVLIFYFGYYEYNGIALGSQISELNTKITSKNTGNNKNLSFSSKFDNLSKQIVELEEFVDSPINITEFLTFLGEALPHEMLLTSISYYDREFTEGKKTFVLFIINIRGAAHGSAKTATQTVYDFINKLENLEMFEDILYNTELDSMVRDDALGLFNFSTVIQLKLDA